MITEKRRAERLRRHEELKRNYEVQLAAAKTEPEKQHLKARIAEVKRDINATKPPEPKALLPKTTLTAEEDAKKAEEHIVQPIRAKPPTPKRKLKKIKKVGNPF